MKQSKKKGQKRGKFNYKRIVVSFSPEQGNQINELAYQKIPVNFNQTIRDLVAKGLKCHKK